MLKGEVEAHFKVIFQHLPGGTEENREILYSG
jgi:hypothetical protein